MILYDIALEDFKLSMGDNWKEHSSVNCINGRKKLYDRQAHGGEIIIETLNTFAAWESGRNLPLIAQGTENETENHQSRLD